MAAILLQKTLTRTDLGAAAVKNIRIVLAKAQVRGALPGLLDAAARSDTLSDTDQALEALTAAAVPLVRVAGGGRGPTAPRPAIVQGHVLADSSRMRQPKLRRRRDSRVTCSHLAPPAVPAGGERRRRRGMGAAAKEHLPRRPPGFLH